MSVSWLLQSCFHVVCS